MHDVACEFACAETIGANVLNSDIVSGCLKLAQKEYKKRQDSVVSAIHWDLSRKWGYDRNDKWCNRTGNENYKILWDFSIRTDHNIEAKKPHLVIVDKSKKSCHIIDVAIQEDSGVKEKEFEKVEKYENLARELRRMWEVKTSVVRIVLGALGTVPLWLKGILKGIDVDTSNSLIQKSALLGSARFLRKVLRMSRTGKRTILEFLGNLLLPYTIDLPAVIRTYAE